MLKRHQDNTCWGDTPITDALTERTYQYWKHKKKATKQRHAIDWKLSGKELMQLLDDAGITHDDVGRSSSSYQLARYEDTGDYAVGNCRYITLRENIQERKFSDKALESMQQSHAARWDNIVTPHGVFNSKSDAGRKIGVTRNMVRRRVDDPKYPDWYQEDNSVDKNHPVEKSVEENECQS